MPLPNLAELNAMQKKARRAAPGRAVPEGLRVVKVGVFSVYLKK